MASLYQRTNSPFWWIKFRDPKTGLTKRASTGFQIGIGPETRKAEQLRAQYTVRETKLSGSAPEERWDQWVPDYIRLRYADAPASLLRHQVAWRTLRMFLEQREITLPRQLTRQQCVDYMAWRLKPDKKNGKYRAGHNTAHLELKVLGQIMKESVLREYAPFNPCRDLEIKRIRGVMKPELTPEAEQLILDGFAKEPKARQVFLRRSFAIARYHGVRLSETHLNPMLDVEVTKQENGQIQEARITFTTKGNKTHTVMLHPKLFPLFQELRRKRATETYAMPKSPAKDWHNYLKRIGVTRKLPGACFHSTRVTVATTLARSGVSEKKAMAYLGHASTTVHRSYVRLRAEDLEDCTRAIQ